MKRTYPKMSDHTTACRERATAVQRALRLAGIKCYKDPMRTQIRVATNATSRNTVYAALFDVGIATTSLVIEEIPHRMLGMGYTGFKRVVVRIPATIKG